MSLSCAALPATMPAELRDVRHAFVVALNLTGEVATVKKFSKTC